VKASIFYMNVQGTEPAKSPAPVRILLVDDHPVVREGLAEMLRRRPGFSICGEADDRAQALSAVESCKPDLAILDLTLKGEPGLELVKDIHALHPELPMLVLSIHDELVHARRVIRAGAAGYINKQEAATKVLAAVERVLGGEIYLSERVTAQITAQFAGRLKGQRSYLEGLTDRELQVLEFIGDGLSTRQTAQVLHLDVSTIETYRARIKEKLALKDAGELLQYAIRWNRSQNL
jgi:DNA-binding NarL/FixJ family response regulator